MTCRSRLISIASILALFATASGQSLDRSPGSPGYSPAWQDGVEQALTAREYFASEVDQTPFPDLSRALQSPNRVQNLRAYFTPEGVRLVRRTETTPTWTFLMSLHGVGRGDHLVAPGPAVPVANGNRVEYRRAGGLTEWYLNEPRGLEQGFTLTSRPAGPVDEPLRLRMSIGGDLVMSLNPAADQVDLDSHGGVRVLQLAELISWDSAGRGLPTHFEQDDGFLSMVVDDRDAQYPIIVDPLATTPDWTVTGDQANAKLGFSLATAGDVNADGYSDVLIAAPWYDGGESAEGKVFAFYGSPAGLSVVADWSKEMNQSNANYGYSVATAGDVNQDGYADVVIGAPSWGVSGSSSNGAVFLHLGSAAGLKSAVKWSDTGDASSKLGFSVSTAGDVNKDGYSDIIVGLPDNVAVTNTPGHARIYYGTSSGIKNGYSLLQSQGTATDAFGWSVSTAGDVNGDGFADVIVGAKYENKGQFEEGTARVYLGASNTINTNAQWLGQSNEASAHFGESVSAAGDVNGDGYSDILVGAPQKNNSAGSVYLYFGKSNGITTADKVVLTAAGQRLGRQVACAGDINGDGYSDILVGQDSNGQVGHRALLYLGAEQGLSLPAAWQVKHGTNGFGHGLSIATAGDVNGDGFSDILIGRSGTSDMGIADLYYGGPEGPSATPGLIVDGGQQDARLGFAIASAGDLNGDGFEDLAVGAHRFDNGEVDEGRVEVYLGSATGPAATPDWTAESDQANAVFGASVAGAGDIDGDGYGDLLIGAREFGNGEAGEGRAFLYSGGPTGLAASPAWTAESDQVQAGYGWSVAGAGDVNGDGYADALISARYFSGGQNSEGRVDVYHGGPSGLPATPDWTYESDQAGAELGRSVASAGDVNGDGYSDVIVGAHRYSGDLSEEGIAFVFLGGLSGLGPTPAWETEGDQANAQDGFSVASAGDTNGDGYADVIIGAWKYDNGETDEGRARVFQGSATGLSTTPAWTVESDQAGAEFGHAVAGGGDVNNDGYADVLVGARMFDDAGADNGQARLYLGSAAGLSVIPDWSVSGAQPDDQLGVTLASADVNGDGYSDVAVGVHFSDTLGVDAGGFQIHYGNNGPGRPVRPRQRRIDDTPIAHLGLADGGQVELVIEAFPTFGNARVAIETEIKPLGVPFDGVGTEMSGFSNLTLTPTDRVKLVSLPEVGAYHWRARVRTQIRLSPFQQWGPWFSPNGDAATEADLRNDLLCPAVTAQAIAYGAGKAGSVGVPTLSSTSPPVVGGVSDLTISNGLPNATPVLLMIGFAPAALAFDGGTLLVTPALTLNLPSLNAGGQLSLPFALPPNPSSCGLSVFLQALFHDPGAAGFYHTAQTNGLQWTLGG